VGETHLSSAFDVLGVATDEGGLLLLVGGHCVFVCVCVWFGLV
jgi:hypothetical protein